MKSDHFHAYIPRAAGSANDAVSRAIDDLGGLKRAAAIVDLTVSGLHQCSSPSVARSLGFDRVQKMTDAGSKAFVEDLCARAGGVFVPVAKPNEDFAALLATYCGEHGEFVARGVAAIADGNVNSIESADLRREIDDAIRALVTARARLMAPEPESMPAL